MATPSSKPIPPRIVGVDPGLNVTGYAVIEAAPQGPKLIEAGVVRGKTKGSLTARLAEIHDGMVDVLSTFQPSVMALEQLFSHYERPRTAIIMGHARGVICLTAAQRGIPVVHYMATRIKKILTGSGRAPKLQMQLAVQTELRLAKPPEPADVADAIAIALCHYHLQPAWQALGQPIGKTVKITLDPPAPRTKPTRMG